jgi:2-hydroxychromene-2-carboxylate isomerase
VFQRGLPINDAATLKAVAAEAGLDAAEAEPCGTTRNGSRLKRANEAAIAAGVFGAPFFIVDGEPFWGNDRQPQIERWLASGPF